MPTCESCGLQLTWKQSFRIQFHFHKYIQCPYCKKKQYIYNNKKAIILLLPLIASPLIVNLFIDFTAFGSIIIGLLVSPFSYKLKNNCPSLQK
ncbi:TIGR04104 family putative zinc finger protein [Alkalicoccus halolimnae]|uniref:TIGR04104 family putative zinc finger protein n=1 Tax=Alkalicoccus halolimnae TaxID=1667239 RepID=UPI003BAE1D70